MKKWLAIGKVYSTLVLETEDDITKAQVEAYAKTRVVFGPGIDALVVCQTGELAIEDTRMRKAVLGGLEVSEKRDGAWSDWRKL